MKSLRSFNDKYRKFYENYCKFDGIPESKRNVLCKMYCDLLKNNKKKEA